MWIGKGVLPIPCFAMTDNQHPLDVEPKEAKSSDTMPVEKESGETDTLGPEEEKRLVRKIDLQYVSLEKQEIHILTRSV